MSDAVTVALIAAVPVLATQVVAIFVGLRNHRQGQDLVAKSQEIHVMINSRMSEMMDAQKALSHNQGVTEGGAAVRDAIRRGEASDNIEP